MRLRYICYNNNDGGELFGEFRYYYDSLGQLIRTDDEENERTTEYIYDGNGNITAVKTYSLHEKDEPSLNTLGFCSVNNINLFSYCNNEPVNNIDPNGHWVARAVISGISGAVFGGIAYLIGRAFRISGWKLAAFTTVFVAAGITIGAIWGPNILYRINSLIKPVLYFFSNPGKVYFGVKFLSVIQFELHNPHHGKSIHFVIRILKDGRWNQILEWVLKK